MILARVDGNVVTSMGHDSLIGQTIVLCTPVDEAGANAGSPFAAVDPLGAGMHARVYVTTDGSWTQDTVHDDHSPIRNQVMGFVD